MPSYVVVGASRGLGYEWLRKLGSDPANTVIGLARTVDPVNAQLAANKISNVHVLQADMVDHKSLNAAAAKAATITKGSVDYLILNGAYNDTEFAYRSPASFTGHEEDLRKDLTKSLEVNVLGVIFAINAFLPLVRKSNIKKIIAISTGLADTEQAKDTGMPFFVAYSSTKAALNMVVARYSVELKDDGITILALSPGLVNTRETPLSPEEQAGVQAMIAKFQIASPNWKGPLTPEESVSHMIKVINDVKLEDTGSFLSHWGNKEWL